MGFDLMLAFMEIVTGGIGLYALYGCMKQLKEVARSQNESEMRKRFGMVVLWALCSSVALVACALIGQRATSVVVLACGISVMFMIAGAMLLVLKRRTFRMQTTAEQAIPPANQLIEVKSLHKGRIRGLNEAGSPIYFNDVEIDDLSGIRGFVRILNWASASRARTAAGTRAMLAFWDEDGNTFLLYPDDAYSVVGT